MTETDFQPFPKMARLYRDIIITEKIDGTNAQINIVHSLAPEAGAIAHRSLGTAGDLSMFAGSRTKLITPKDDNFGFAKWVETNSEELFKLGPGRHFGEWWGGKIQRGYGLKEKRFSLFNVSKWKPHDYAGYLLDGEYLAPKCCYVVPTLYRGLFSEGQIEAALTELEFSGSKAAPGFMDPEGIVIYHVAAGVGFKKTIKNDEVPKGMLKND